MTNGLYAPDFATSPARSGDSLFWIDSRGGPRRALWTARADGSEPRMLLGGTDAVTGFRAFDQGRRLVVATDCGGDEHHQLRVISADGSAPARHITSDFFVINNLGAVSADGTRLAFASNRAQRERFDIAITCLTSFERRDFVLGEGEWKVEAWAADGTGLYVSLGRATGDIALYRLCTKTGELRSLIPVGPARFHEIRPVEGGVLLRTDWGNDNLYVAFLAEDGSLTSRLRVPGRDIDAYLPLDGGARILASVNAELGHELHLAGPSGTEILDLPLTLRGPLSFNGPDRILWAEQTASMPSRIVDYDLATGDLRVLVQPHQGLIQGIRAVETFRATAADGREVPALIYRPEAPNGACLFMIHGGPESQWLPNCQPWVAEMCRRGWTVIAPNVRGSLGFGRNWLLLDNMTLRRDVIGDITALYDAAVTREGLDPARMGVMGESYGGFMTALQLGFETDRWAVAAIIYGFADVPKLVNAFGSWRRPHRMWEYGNPDDPQVLAFQQALSPLPHLSKVKVPVFMYHARRDMRVPIEQSDMIEAALRSGGAPVTRMGADDEGHGYVNPNTRNALWTGLMAHFEAVFDA